MVLDALRAYLQLASGVTEESRQRAVAVARSVLAQTPSVDSGATGQLHTSRRARRGLGRHQSSEPRAPARAYPYRGGADALTAGDRFGGRGRGASAQCGATRTARARAGIPARRTAARRVERSGPQRKLRPPHRRRLVEGRFGDQNEAGRDRRERHGAATSQTGRRAAAPAPSAGPARRTKRGQRREGASAPTCSTTFVEPSLRRRRASDRRAVPTRRSTPSPTFADAGHRRASRRRRARPPQDVAAAPVDEHVAIYDDVHRRLQDALADLDGS